VEAAHDEAITLGVDEREREALIAAGVLKGIEPDQADPLKRSAPVRLEHRRTRRQLVELSGHGVDLVEMGVEDRLEAVSALAPGDAFEPITQPADPARLEEDNQEEDNEPRTESGCDRSDIRLDERVEIDERLLRRGSAGV
jgi:hypothetical protein